MTPGSEGAGTDRTFHYFAGVACAFGYIVIASLQSVALNEWLATANVYLVVGIGFTVVTVCFVTVGLVTGGLGAYRTLIRRPGVLLALNVTSVFNWLFYFLAVKYLDPAVAVTLTQGLGPLSMTAYNLARRQHVSSVTLACQSAILAAACLMCTYVLVNGLTPGPYDRVEIAMGIGIGVVCSLSITATLVLSKSFADSAVPASVLLSARFPLLIMTCAAILPTQATVEFSGRTIAIAVGVGLIGISVATYLLQRGVELAPRLAVSLCLSLAPLVVFAIDAVRHFSVSDLTVFVLILVVVLASMISIVHDGRRIGSAPPERAAEEDSRAGALDR